MQYILTNQQEFSNSVICHARPTYSHISRLILRSVSISYASTYPDTSGHMQPACLHNIQTSRPLPSLQIFMSSHIWPSGIHTLRHPYLSTPTPLDTCSQPAYITSRPHPYTFLTHPSFHSSTFHSSAFHLSTFHLSKNHTTHLIQKSALSPI
jgi:hypothetical protein